MHKIMALDIGTKRIGVALSDFLHIVATPVLCVERVPESDAIKTILKFAFYTTMVLSLNKGEDYGIHHCY